MFERFTPAARLAVVDAQAWAGRLGHGYVGPEHVLLAVAAGPGGGGEVLRSRGVSVASLEPVLRRPRPLFRDVDGEALAWLGIDLDAIRERLSESGTAVPLAETRRSWWWRRGRSGRAIRRSGRIGRPPFTDAAKRGIERSLRESVALKDGHIATEHLVLGLIRADRGPLAAALDELGVSAAALRAPLLEHRRA